MVNLSSARRTLDRTGFLCWKEHIAELNEVLEVITCLFVSRLQTCFIQPLLHILTECNRRCGHLLVSWRGGMA